VPCGCRKESIAEAGAIYRPIDSSRELYPRRDRHTREG
jgi:hypothetical protein